MCKAKILNNESCFILQYILAATFRFHYSSPVLHKNALRKLGDPFDNELATKQSDSASFRKAWEEVILVVEFIKHQREQEFDDKMQTLKIQTRSSAATLTIDNVKSTKTRIQEKRLEIDTNFGIIKCSVILNRVKDPSDVVDPSISLEGERKTHVVADANAGIRKCSVVLNRVIEPSICAASIALETKKKTSRPKRDQVDANIGVDKSVIQNIRQTRSQSKRL